MTNLYLAILAVLFLGACGSDSGSGSGGNKPNATEYLASYEFDDGCSTGRHVFFASSEENISRAFCEALKDNNLNKNCGLYQRYEAFKTVKCSGVWPNQIPSGWNQSSSKYYAYQKNGCSTGIHFFGASTENSMLRMYCRTLSNEEYNRNCAKESRIEDYNKSKCDDILK